MSNLQSYWRKLPLKVFQPFKQPEALNNALTEAMQGLTKLVAVTILKNAAIQVVEGVNIDAIVDLLITNKKLLH